MNMGEETTTNQHVTGGRVWQAPQRKPLPTPGTLPTSFNVINQIVGLVPFIGAITYAIGFLTKVAHNQRTDITNIPQLIVSYMQNPVVAVSSISFIGISGLVLTAYVGFKPLYSYPDFSHFMSGKLIHLMLSMLISLMLLGVLQFVALDIIHNWLNSFQLFPHQPILPTSPPHSRLKFF